MIVAVDFDGTIVEHEYPDVGKPVPGAIEWMRRWQDAGAKLILWTMRDRWNQVEGRDCLREAVDYCKQAGVEFHGVNRNPEQQSWTGSPKVYANIYVDDAAFGCPLIESMQAGKRPFVNWEQVGPAVLYKINHAKVSR